MKSDKKVKFAVLGLLVVVLAGAAMVKAGYFDKVLPAQPDDMVFSWAAPTVGTTVVKYEVQIREGGSDGGDSRNMEVTTNSVTFDVDWLTLYEVRVRGVDASNRIGPWSEWSLAEDRDHEEPSF
ncbi:MAG: hypothetical protein ACI9UK_000346 [Candidatus Krumholzibacteriia bacterium]|jgi:hypothetical protein